MKKIIILLVALFSMATLVACGESDPKTTAPTVTEGEQTTQPTTLKPEEIPTEDTEPGTEESTTSPTEEEGEWKSYYNKDGTLRAKDRYVDDQLMEEILYEDGKETFRRLYSYEDDETTVALYQNQELKSIKTQNAEENPVVYTNYLQGKPIWRNTFTYDDAGELSSYQSEVLNENGKPVRKMFMEGGYLYGEANEYFDGGTEQWCRSYTYADNGELLSEQEDSSLSGECANRHFYFYDDNGNLLATFNSQTGQEYEAGYDQQGRILYEINYFDPEADYTTYSYDENGVKSGYLVGATYGSTQLTYNEEGKLVLEVFYGDGEAEFKTSYEHNQHGDVRKKETIDLWSEETETCNYEYTYREDGQWSEQVCELLDSRVTRSYNEAGQLVEEVTHEEFATTYTYNDLGQLIRADRTYEESPDTETYLYFYDELDRLVEEIYIFS